MKPFLPLVIAAIVALSGACTTSQRIQVMRPADIDVPKDVKKIVVVNRYKPTGKNAWINVLEGMFTGEMIMADRRGVDQAMNGLLDGLRGSERYEIVLANVELPGNGLGIFPEPLAKAQIQNLAKQYNADAVLAIEAFDSNVTVATEAKTRTEKKNGKEYTITYFQGQENVNLTIGWRLYSAANGGIIDQNQVFKSLFFSSEGDNPRQAIARLVFPADAVAKTGFEGGMVYAARIAPSWQWAQREFYGSGNPAMKQAKKMARRGDWENAALIWKAQTQNISPKIAKRATYNMAVAAEMMGDYDLAIEWARKAANNYNLRRADNYIYVLKAQKAAWNKVNQQLAPVDSVAK